MDFGDEYGQRDLIKVAMIFFKYLIYVTYIYYA